MAATKGVSSKMRDELREWCDGEIGEERKEGRKNTKVDLKSPREYLG